MTQETPQLKVIRKPEVLSLIGLSSSMLYRLINDRLLPPPFSLGCRASGWYEHEIKVVVQALAAGKDNNQITKLVSNLIDARHHDYSEV